jgi:hypothetical protein
MSLCYLNCPSTVSTLNVECVIGVFGNSLGWGHPSCGCVRTQDAWLLPAAVAAAAPFSATLIVVEKNMVIAHPDRYHRTLFLFGSVRTCKLAGKPLTN